MPSSHPGLMLEVLLATCMQFRVVLCKEGKRIQRWPSFPVDRERSASHWLSRHLLRPQAGTASTTVAPLTTTQLAAIIEQPGLSWQARIADRALEGTGCPNCYELRRGRKADGSRTNHPTLRGASGNHPLMAEWDIDANEKAGLRPEKIKLRSRIPVNWICRKCPLGLLHLWKATPNDRTQKCSGCPYCDAQKACKCNSLQTHFHDLVEEWDFDRNKDAPGNYTARSHAEVWWRTAERGSWQQRIDTRTDRRLKRHQLRALKQ